MQSVSLPRLWWCSVAVAAGLSLSCGIDDDEIQRGVDVRGEAPGDPCVSAVDCAEGETCEDGLCRLPASAACTDEAARCSDDGASLQTCDPASGTWIVTRCAPDLHCFAQGDSAACLDRLCEPDSEGCLDAHTAYACDATGSTREDRPCAQEQVCLDGGVCGAAVCEPGETTCAGEHLVTCDERGGVAASVLCSEHQACTEEPAGCACEDGACVVRECAPSTARCEGNSAQLCDDRGLSWLSPVPCGDEASCVDGHCLPRQCEPRSVSCAGEVLRICDAQGTNSFTVDCSDAGELCSEVIDPPACVAPACVPDAVSCHDQEDAVEACDSRGLATTLTPCEEGAVCIAPGLCGPPPPLDAPTSVEATQGTSALHVALSWAPVDDAEGYHVYREGVRITASAVEGTVYLDEDAPSGLAPPALVDLAASTDQADAVYLAWQHGDLAPGPAVAYRVRAVARLRESPRSAPVTGFRAPLPITGHEVRVEDMPWASLGLDLAWRDEDASAPAFDDVEISATDTRTDGIEVDLLAFALQPGESVSYAVRAVNDAGPGEEREVAGHRAAPPHTLRLLRAESPEGPFALVEEDGSFPYVDDDTLPGVAYAYQVEARAPGVAPKNSSAVTGRRRVSCALADCDAVHRSCVDPGGSDDAVCGGCLSSHQALDGVCVPLTWSLVSSGTNFTCGIADNGTLWCWGTNGRGQLGLGDTEQRLRPTQVTSTHDWSFVAAGDQAACGVRNGGELWCWGDNEASKLGLGDTEPRLEPTRVQDGPAWSLVSGASSTVCGVYSDGMLACWGAGSAGQLGMGGDMQAAERPTQVGRETSWRAVSAEWNHTCGLREDDSLWCWGSSAQGRLGLGVTMSQFTPQRVGSGLGWIGVDVGRSHTCGIMSGQLLCWGDASNGRIGNGETSGTLFEPVRVGDEEDWFDLDLGEAHGCALRGSGELWCWGQGLAGRLGHGSVADAALPVRVGDADDWRQVSAGQTHTCGIRDGGTLWCWGFGNGGRLGQGNTAASSTPLPVHFPRESVP